MATLSPSAGPAPAPRGFCIVCGGVGGVDAVLNVLLFLPFGFGLGLAGWSGRRAFAAVVAVTIAVEFLQLTVVPGRDPSGGDVVMNSIGGAIGFWAAATRLRWLHPSRALAAALTIGMIGGWLAIQALGAHALTPSLSDRPWYCQARRPLPPFREFEPDVRRVMLDGIPLPLQRFDPAEARARLLGGNVTLHTVLVPGPAPRGTAAIFRITDDRRDEMLLLGRRGQALVFRLRSEAADLRFRQPAFTLPHAFTDGPAGEADGTVLTVRLAPGRVVLGSARDGVAREETIRLSASWAWTLVMPFTVPLGTAIATLGTALWLVGFLLPAGYWARCAWGRESRGAPGTAAVAGLAALGLGLWVIPGAFGMDRAATYEWAAATAGLVAGWMIGSRVQWASSDVQLRRRFLGRAEPPPVRVA